MKKYWDSTEIGDGIKELRKLCITRTQIAIYCAASNDFSPLCLDDDFAKSAGFGGVYAPGTMALGFMEEALRTFASNMTLISMSSTFQRFIWPGDSLTTRGMVLRRYQKNDENRIFFKLWCLNQNGELVLKGHSVCSLFKNAKHETEQKLTAPLVSQESRLALEQKCQTIIKRAASKTAALVHS